MGTIVIVNRQGRITLPIKIREELHLGEDAALEVETRDGGIFLRPAVVFTVPREDAWAYTPEESAAIERARHSPIVPGVTEEDLEAINASADPEQAARDLIARKLYA